MIIAETPVSDFDVLLCRLGHPAKTSGMTRGASGFRDNLNADRPIVHSHDLALMGNSVSHRYLVKLVKGYFSPS